MARDDKGAVAIEFSILALPFFTIIFAILETAMTFFAQQLLESAVQDVSRFIQTGQAQAIGTDWDESDFRTAMCDQLYGMFDCAIASDPTKSRMQVRISVVTSFSAATVTPPVSAACGPGASEAQCDWAITSAYNDGTRNQVILVQAYYKWPTIVSLPWFNLETQAGGNRLLSAVRVFRNEPF